MLVTNVLYCKKNSHITLFLYKKRGKYCKHFKPKSNAAISGILVKVFSRIKHQILCEFSGFVAKLIATAPPITIFKYNKHVTYILYQK